jgi:hypothetical protein
MPLSVKRRKPIYIAGVAVADYLQFACLYLKLANPCRGLASADYLDLDDSNVSAAI